jgi:hypothetical protein
MRSSVNSRGCSTGRMAAFSAGSPKRVEADGRQHGVALHRAVAHDEVAEGVVAHVAHVGRPRSGTGTSTARSTGPGIVVVDLVGARVAPALLPLGLDDPRVVAVGRHPRIVVTAPRLPRTGCLGRRRSACLMGAPACGRVHLPLGAIAQLVERFHGMEEVRSSILLSSTRSSPSTRWSRRSDCSGVGGGPGQAGHVAPQPLELVERRVSSRNTCTTKSP